jgi:hypothetical protein
LLQPITARAEITASDRTFADRFIVGDSGAWVDSEAWAGWYIAMQQMNVTRAAQAVNPAIGLNQWGIIAPFQSSNIKE